MVVLALWTSALVISAIGHGFLLVILGIIVFVFISPGGSDIGQYPVQEIKKGLLPAAVSMVSPDQLIASGFSCLIPITRTGGGEGHNVL